MSDTPHEDHPRVIGLIHYLGAFVTLLVLTAVTVGAAHIPLGFLNTHVAMGLATAQVIIVAAVFMGLITGGKANPLFLGAAVVVTGLFVAFTLVDVFTRSAVEPLHDTLGAQKAQVAQLRLKAEQARKAEPPPGFPDEAVAPEDERAFVPPPPMPDPIMPGTDAMAPGSEPGGAAPASAAPASGAP